MHSPYLPDISSIDCHLFRHSQLFSKNKIFDAQEAVTAIFKEFLHTKTMKFYKNISWNLIEKRSLKPMAHILIE